MGEFLDSLSAEIDALKSAGALSKLPLEPYLRSMWGLLEKEQHSAASYDLFIHILLDSLDAPPVPFNPDWYEYHSLPRIVMPPTIDPLTIDPFDCVRQTILYQIADLNRLADQIAKSKALDLFAGIRSPNGFDGWYNFSVYDFLCAGLVGIQDDIFVPSSLLRDRMDLTPSWTTLALFLQAGQEYE